MPAVVVSSPGIPLKEPPPPTAPPVEDHLIRRNSRAVEYHSAIPEEDESVGTASEPAEPITPTSDIAPPFPNNIHHHEANGVEQSKELGPQHNLPTRLPPAPAQPKEQAPVPAPVVRTKSNIKMDASPEKSVPAEKPHLGKRVGSFVRHKLHRVSSHKDTPKDVPTPPAPNEKIHVNTNVTNADGSNDMASAPIANMPKYRRLSSFSLSARNSPKSSHPNSPPSPSSPSSTISNNLETEKTAIGGHKHSTSSTAINNMTKPGITWAGGGQTWKKPSRFARRRSASTEDIPKARSNEGTIGLIDTFSRPAEEGVGLKARRLSVSLPDEFVVDSCDLDKEYKSSSLMPGKRGKCLGRGATAEVRIMARKGVSGGEELVAVKEFRAREKDEDEDEYIKKIKSEYCIAKSLHHPNIVETVRLCTNRGRWNHVMEYCSHGELFSLVERKLFSVGGDGHYSVQDRLCLFKQLLRGVDYLHTHGIAHRDIKLENLLLDKDGHLKISDFGVAEVFSGEHPGVRVAAGECGKNMGDVRLSKPGICGSLPYIAPEVLEKKENYDPRPLDIWSCAIVFLTMTFGGSPWQAAKTEYEYYAKFKKGWDEWLETHPDGQITDAPDGHPRCGKIFSLITPPPIKRLLLKMLHPIPEKRITIKEIMASPCVKNIDCCCPEGFDEPNCCIDTSKCTTKETSKMTKQFLHRHIPPPPEKKFARAFTHRFDMGDGY